MCEPNIIMGRYKLSPYSIYVGLHKNITYEMTLPIVICAILEKSFEVAINFKR